MPLPHEPIYTLYAPTPEDTYIPTPHIPSPAPQEPTFVTVSDLTYIPTQYIPSEPTIISVLEPSFVPVSTQITFDFSLSVQNTVQSLLPSLPTPP